MATQLNGNTPQAPYSCLRETLLTLARPLGPNEFSYVTGRGELGYTDSYTIALVSCTGGHVITDDEVVAASRIRELEARVRDLELLLGRKTLEVEVLKEALAAARIKKVAWPLPSLPAGSSR